METIERQDAKRKSTEAINQQSIVSMPVSPNPYRPAPDPPATLDDADSTITPGRNRLCHLLGLTSFLVGIASWSILYAMPTGHPAYGGPAISRVIAILVITAGSCLLTMAAVAFIAYRRRAPWTLIYAAPALGYVEYLLLTLVV